MTVDVVIPVYKPGEELPKLIHMLQTQTIPPGKIILMNTERELFEHFLTEHGDFTLPRNVEVYHVTKEEYDHGFTRHTGALKSEAELLLFMTQDAVCADNSLIEKLAEPFSDSEVAVSYGRQLATEKSGVFEKIAREFNYPDQSRIKSAEDLPTLGIKTYFCSNVCAMYRKDVYNKQGGFIHHTIFNEDMIYAAGVIKAGYKIAYCAEARVYHAHNYTNLQQLRRNFDLGVSQADHPEVFEGISSESEGKKLVKEAGRILKEQKKRRLLPKFYMQCACKYAGFLLGKRYTKLPRKFVKKLSMNKEYWKVS